MPEHYVYSKFSNPRALQLEIEGVVYEVTQFSCSYAVSEIPTAVCMLAIGRNARTKEPAKVHTQSQAVQMKRAKVYFQPERDYSRVSQWPAGRKVIFDGFFTGFAYRKINGKVHAIANLIHWLAALGMSSCLTKNGHVANPTALNAAAVLQSLGSTGAAQGVYISSLVPAQIVAQNVASDLWKAIKQIFCKLADIDTMPVGPTGQCGGGGNYVKNDMAKEALNKIEGPADACNVPYRWGVPLKLDTLGVYSIEDAIAQAVGQENVESYSACSFWDKLVGQFCPMFGMAVVPMAEKAIVIADTPALSGDPFVYWKELDPTEYDAFDMSAELFRPLRAVGVVASYDSQTHAGMEEAGNQFPIIGGCYVEDSVRAGDGMIQYIAPPPWLRMLRYQPNYIGHNSADIANGGPSRTSTTPTTPPQTNPTPDTFGLQGNELYKRYAHAHYVNTMLRGRSGSVSGKLRFDIAPGSIIKINPSLEVFLGGEDELAYAVYACVNRVTITINAESAMAGTTLALSHMRTEPENSRPRTSVKEHPLFGSAIHGGGKHGCPLVDDYDLP